MAMLAATVTSTRRPTLAALYVSLIASGGHPMAGRQGGQGQTRCESQESRALVHVDLRLRATAKFAQCLRGDRNIRVLLVRRLARFDVPASGDLPCVRPGCSRFAQPAVRRWT